MTAVDGVDLEIGRGEFFTMLGPSGSGKTTTLRVIAGFERPDEGTVELGGKDVSQLPPYARDVNTVFQDYALFPHMTVEENVEYGLRVKKVARGERRRRAGEALALVQLEDYGGRKPAQLSGGQRQRVALARAIVNRPQALLLDEPLGALDLKLRQELQVELKRIQQELGITFVYVTHDQEEALTMSDRLAVFNQGRIEQIGAPAEVYEHPASEFIAGFIGVSNVLERDGRRFTVRPEKIRLLGEGSNRSRASIVEEGRIRDVVYVGAITRYHVELDAGGELTVVSQNLESGSSEVLERQGSRVRLSWRPEHVFVIETGSNGGESSDERSGKLDAGLRRCSSPAFCASWPQAAAATTTRPAERGRQPRRRPAGAPEGMLQTLGEGEGQVNLIAWAGYVEDGSTDPKVDWVTDFEKETGCQVNTKVGNTSDEMVTLMRTGQYDGVSASGDATLRLIAAGDVAPVNTDLIPNYADVFEGLKNQPHNSVDGQMYGVPHGRGANLLMWRTDKVTPAPDSLEHRLGRELAVQGQGDGVRQPDLHRRRGALPEGDPAGPQDRQRLRARRRAVQAAIDLLKKQRANIGEYWSDYTKEQAAFAGGQLAWSARPGR